MHDYPRVKSKTSSYRTLYSLSKPLLPMLYKLFPNHVLAKMEIGRMLLAVDGKCVHSHS